MDLNILLRGQSNAFYLGDHDDGAAARVMVQEVERLLGFDGSTDSVRLLFRGEGEDPAAATTYGATAFLGDWIAPINGDWRDGWQPALREQGLLSYISGLPASQRDDPTAVLWLHNEYDSIQTGLTAEEWTSGVRFDAGLVRQALGQPAATVPYLFVSAIPFQGESNQTIRVGMEQLAADPAFHAAVAARVLDLDMDFDDPDGDPDTPDFGGSHISVPDAYVIALRAARGIAEAFAAHARPGSPMALAGGDIDDDGPQVVEAVQLGDGQLALRVAHDRAGGFTPLDAEASSGVGWSVRTSQTSVAAREATVLAGDWILLRFDEPLPAEGRLFYGYGNGRLAASHDRPGQGNAIYDDQGQPLWVAADGLPIGGWSGQVLPGSAPPPAPGTGTPADDSLVGTQAAEDLTGLDGNDTLQGDAGDDRLDGGAGLDTAVFSDTLANHAFDDRGSAGVRVTAKDGTDVLVGIERVQFADGPVLLADGDPLFDPLFYLSANPDVRTAGMDPAAHFAVLGWREGRNPNAWFDSAGYLAANPDARAAGLNPLEHYRQLGWREGRDPSAAFDLQRYLAENPDVQAAGTDPLIHYLEFGRAEDRPAHPAIGLHIEAGFDRETYLMANPDVAQSGMDPLRHFREFGWREGRAPNALFDVEGYLSAYPDVRAAGVDPLAHYRDFGWREGRDPSPEFDTSDYLVAYSDIAAGGMSPLEHFLRFGAAEGRQTFSDGAWG